MKYLIKHLWFKFFLGSVLVLTIILLTMSLLWDGFFRNLTLRHEMNLIDKNVAFFTRRLDDYLAAVRTLSFDIVYHDDVQAAVIDPKNSALGTRRPLFGAVSSELAYYLCLENSTGELIYEQGTSHDQAGFENDYFVQDTDSLYESWTFVRNTKARPPHSHYMMLISYYRRLTALNDLSERGRFRIDVTEMALRNQYADINAHSFIMNEQGGILSSLISAQVSQNVSLYYTDSFQLPQSFIGSFTTDSEGVAMYVSYKMLSASGWYFVSVIPVDSLLARNLAQRFYFMIAIAVAFLFAALLLLLISKLINRPFRQLINTMNSYHPYILQHDAQHFTPKTKGNDIRALSASFTAMKNRIESMLSEMSEMHRAELQSQSLFLQAQIEPHFLYNTLESIRFTARLNNDEQVSLQIKALSDILKHARSSERFVTLDEEVKLARQYIFLQQQGCADMLDFIIDIDSSCKLMLVPRLILQPLIENSIKHGLQSMDNAGVITIAAYLEQDNLVMEVHDNGVGIEDHVVTHLLSDDDSGKTGLRNINKRLKLYYGEAYGIKIGQKREGGAVVRVRIPSPDNPIYARVIEFCSKQREIDAYEWH